jgi:hypothetical protein
MRLLLKPTRYVFYRLLTWKLRDLRDPSPVVFASFATFLLLFFNAIGMAIIVNIILGHRPVLGNFPGGRGALAVVVLGGGLLAYAAMSAAWVQDGKFSRLVEEFRPDPRRDPVRNVLFWGYFVISIVLPIVLAVVYSIKPGSRPQ